MRTQLTSGRDWRPFRTPLFAVTAGLAVLLVLVLRSTLAVADCPRYETDNALRFDRSTVGSVGTFSGQFAAADRVARPGDYCAEVDYQPEPGLHGRARRVKTPLEISRSVALSASGLTASNVDVAFAVARRQEAGGARETVVSQQLTLDDLQQQTRWIHEIGLDRLVVSGAGTALGFVDGPVTARGSLEMQRGQTVPGIVVANVQTEIGLDVAGFQVTAGRSGAPQVGRRETWSLAIDNTIRLFGLRLRRTAIGLSRLAGRNDKVTTAVDATALGHQIHFESGSTRNRDWQAGLDLTLIDAVAGDLSLGVDLDRDVSGVDRQMMLSGQLSW